MEVTELLTADFVQARIAGVTPDDQPDQYLVTEFVVQRTEGTKVYGSVLYPDGVDAADGWKFELIHRAVSLPTTLSEIEAVRFDDQVLRLIGRGNTWTDEKTGQRVPVADIKQFTLIS